MSDALTPSLKPDSLIPLSQRAKGVSAVLGPTNTGKTYLAIERMIAHGSGMIGLPLRLLAREVYGHVVEKVGAEHVALITGEEKIKPKHPRYWIATVEAMPHDVRTAFVAVDEIQLATDPDRGHIFTDRILNARGLHETLLLGAATMQPLITQLIPNIQIVSRPRLSTLTFTSDTKITRLPPRTAIVAFSAEEVYAIAELIRRQRGGAAVVMGALSPRTRNAQVELYQSGEVDYIVATDAIGMGLNLDVQHVAFAACQKFDGRRHRLLSAAELGQIAGRAGRHLQDGTFGTTGRCPSFDDELIERLQNHQFDPVIGVQWRSPHLDFSSWTALKISLSHMPRERGLMRAPEADDERALDMMERDVFIFERVKTRAHLELLWQVARVPDYRKLSTQAHNELVIQLARHLLEHRTLPEDWLARQIGVLDRVDGDIDTLSTRMAHMRTWSYVANQKQWLTQPEYWQEVTRALEEKLSDALHERLTQRFIDRRTGVLMRRLKENAMIEAEVTTTGDVQVEGQSIGTLMGFQFAPDPTAEGVDAKALRATAARVLISALEAKAERLYHTPDTGFMLTNDGLIRWEGQAVGRLVAGDTLLKPRVMILADDYLLAEWRERVESRVSAYVATQVQMRLGPLVLLEASEGISGMARGIAYQIVQAMGVLDRAAVAEDVKGLDQDSRAALRTLGVRFGAYHLYMPLLLKPKPRQLAVHLWLLKSDTHDTSGLEEMAHLAESGRTSFPANPAFSADLYRVAGYRLCGQRVVRVDILERLADLIRPAVMYRPGVSGGTPPEGTADYDGFVVTGSMTSLAGCAGDDFAEILKSLGYVLDRRAGPAITKPLRDPQPVQPVSISAQDASQDHFSTDQTQEDAQASHDDTAQQDAMDSQILEASENVEELQHEEVSDSVPIPDAPVYSVSNEPTAVDQALSETPESPVADDVSSEAGMAEALSAEASLKPQLIDVWRPRRQQHHAHHHGAHKAKGAPREGQKRETKPRVFVITPRPVKPVSSEAGEGGSPAQHKSLSQEGTVSSFPQREGAGGHHRRDKGERADGARNKPQRDQKDFKKESKEGSRGGDGRGKRHDQRDERPRLSNTAFKGDASFDTARRDQEQGNIRLLASTEAQRKGKEPDPLSPFAKLLALKGEIGDKK